MKKILLFIFLVVSFISEAQISISNLPTYTGDPYGGWVPIVVNGTTRKTTSQNVGNLDSLSIVSGTTYDTLKVYKNQVLKYYKLIRAGSTFDTTAIYTAIGLKVNISDTATMLGGYTRVQRFLDSLTAITNRAVTTIDGLTDVVITGNADSTFLQYDSTNGVWRNQSLSNALTGGDTTIFDIVLDSTGQQNQRVLFSKNRKIASDGRFLFDDTNHKLVINGANISVGGVNTKLWVGGNTNITGTATIGTVATSVDTTTYKPAILGSDGIVRKLTYWPIGSSADSSIYQTVYRTDTMRTRIDNDLIGKLSNITGLVTAGTNVTLTGSGTSGSPYVVSATAGGSGDSSFSTLEVGTAPVTIGTLVNESFSGGSIPSGWTKGTNLTTSYAGGKLNVIGATYWNAPAGSDNTTAWLSGMQYDTERMPWEKVSFQMTVIPSTKSAGGLIAVTHGSNGFSLISRETIAWNLSNDANSGRVALGVDSLITWTTGSDSTSKMSWSTGDTLVLYYEKDGWGVTAGIINKTTGTKTVSYFNQVFNGQGGRWNLIFLKTTTDVTNVKVTANDRVGGVWFLGDSQTSGSGVTSESRRWPNLVMKSNYKHFGVLGLPAVAAKYFYENGISAEVIARAQPSKVIIALGYNDQSELNGLTAAQTKVSVDSIGYPLQRSGATVSIMGLVPRNTTSDAYNDSLSNLATTRGWSFLDIRTPLKDAAGKFLGRYSYDGVHINDSGNVVVANVVEAKIGNSLLQTTAADSNFVIKIYTLPTAQVQTSVRLLGQQSDGKIVAVANTLPTPAKYIENKYTSNTYLPKTIAQANAWIHVSGIIRSDTAIQTSSVQAGRFGYSDDNTSNTTGANLNITNAGAGGVGAPQAYDIFTGAGNIKIIASSANKPKSSMVGTISGSNNLLMNSHLTSTLSGSGNTALNTYTWAGTSGNNNFFGGVAGGKGITTGSNNIDIESSGVGGPSTNVSNTMNFGDGQYSFNNDAKASGDVSFCAGPVTHNFWFGGKATGAIAVNMNPTAVVGANQNGIAWNFRSGRGTGTGLSGTIVFQTWDAVGSGSTFQSVTNTEITIARDSLQFDAIGKFNSQIQVKVRTGISASADYTVVSTDYFMELPDLGATAAHNCVLPINSGTGRVLEIVNLNNGANKWTFTGATVTDAAGAAITTLTDQKTYILTWNGSLWRAKVL